MTELPALPSKLPKDSDGILQLFHARKIDLGQAVCMLKANGLEQEAESLAKQNGLIGDWLAWASMIRGLNWLDRLPFDPFDVDQVNNQANRDWLIRASNLVQTGWIAPEILARLDEYIHYYDHYTAGMIRGIKWGVLPRKHALDWPVHTPKWDKEEEKHPAWDAIGDVLEAEGADIYLVCNALHGMRPTKSELGPNYISVYRNYRDFVLNRRTDIRIGRFLKSIIPSMPDEKVRQAVSVIKEDLTFVISRDPRDIVAAYDSPYCRSCMTGKALVTTSGEVIHPAMAYLHPENNLAIAFLKDPLGRIIARTIVNTERKQFVRVYGDSRLNRHLKDNGYTQSENTVLGEKLILYRLKEGIACPFIDYHLGLRIEKDHLLVVGLSGKCYSDSSGILKGVNDES